MSEKKILVPHDTFEKAWEQGIDTLQVVDCAPTICSSVQANPGELILKGDRVILVEHASVDPRRTPTGRKLELEVEAVLYGGTLRTLAFSKRIRIGRVTAEQPPVDAVAPPPFANRHNSVRQICEYFNYSHLPLELQAVVEPICSTIDILLEQIDDSEELTAGLRKLLEAKDCFVRAKLSSKKREGV